mmetsp:Transcript_5591/g.13001  ORF Transcript_5591/g.13001 Transcript_5591/m.13001 type:complete len:327 (-) Transcript_5591:27-1007(-)
MAEHNYPGCTSSLGGSKILVQPCQLLINQLGVIEIQLSRDRHEMSRVHVEREPALRRQLLHGRVTIVKVAFEVLAVEATEVVREVERYLVVARAGLVGQGSGDVLNLVHEAIAHSGVVALQVVCVVAAVDDHVIDALLKVLVKGREAVSIEVPKVAKNSGCEGSVAKSRQSESIRHASLLVSHLILVHSAGLETVDDDVVDGEVSSLGVRDIGGVIVENKAGAFDGALVLALSADLDHASGRCLCHPREGHLGGAANHFGVHLLRSLKSFECLGIKFASSKHGAGSDRHWEGSSNDQYSRYHCEHCSRLRHGYLFQLHSPAGENKV